MSFSIEKLNLQLTNIPDHLTHSSKDLCKQLLVNIASYRSQLMGRVHAYPNKLRVIIEKITRFYQRVARDLGLDLIVNNYNHVPFPFNFWMSIRVRDENEPGQAAEVYDENPINNIFASIFPTVFNTFDQNTIINFFLVNDFDGFEAYLNNRVQRGFVYRLNIEFSLHNTERPKRYNNILGWLILNETIDAAQRLRLVRLILNQPVFDFNLKSFSDHKTVIELAVERKLPEIIYELLKVSGVRHDYKYANDDTLLMIAIREHWTVIIELLLNMDNAYLNRQDESGDTALILAIRHQRGLAVEILNRLGTDTNKINEALNEAICKADLDLVKAILALNCVDINLLTDYLSPLMRAIAFENLGILRAILLHPNLKINLLNKEQFYTALIYAVSNGNYDAVIELLAVSNINVNLQTTTGNTAIIEAVKKSRLEILKLLLIKNSSGINLQEINGNTALIYAVKKGYLAILQKLLDVDGIDLDIQNDDGYTALMLAVMQGNKDIITLLLARGSTVDLASFKYGRTALMICALFEKADALKLLLLAGANVNFQNVRNRRTALIEAANNGNLDVLDALLNAPGIKVNLQSSNGTTALMEAVNNAHLAAVVRLLENHDINVNVQNMEGNTALMIAVRGNRIEIIKALLAALNVNLDLENVQGQTVFDLAQGNEEVLDLLNRHTQNNANLNVCANTRQTAVL